VLVLAKPLGGKTYSLALEVVRRLEDGSVDGTTWHSLGP
jgi:hypothetical protein